MKGRRFAHSRASGTRSRLERLAKRRVRGNITTVVVSTLAIAVVAVLALTLINSARHLKLSSGIVAAAGPLPSNSIVSSDGSGTAVATAASPSVAGPEIEVPTVTGKSVKVAEALLVAAGFTVQTRVAQPPASGVQPDQVTAQWPASGALVASGSLVVVTYQPRTATGTVEATAAPVVVIDAGHQQKPDLGVEPIGPGSKTTKPKVAAGATGAVTGQTEYALDLAIAMKLRDALVQKGVRVVMVRTTDNVDIPNSKRALLANSAKADLFVRVHLNSATDTSVHGVDVLYPAGNRWVGAIEPASMKAAQQVETAVLKATGANWLGLSGRSDQSGFNYCTRPAISVECGFLSNEAEEKLLVTSAYQMKIASGIGAGVMAFLAAK